MGLRRFRPDALHQQMPSGRRPLLFTHPMVVLVDGKVVPLLLCSKRRLVLVTLLFPLLGFCLRPPLGSYQEVFFRPKATQASQVYRFSGASLAFDPRRLKPLSPAPSLVLGGG